MTGNMYADSMVNKTHDGLPYIPGRTLKGLLREAAEVIHDLHPKLMKAEFIQEMFGQAPTADQIAKEESTFESTSFFGNATLSPYLRQNIEKEHKSALYKVISSTSIGENGLAKSHTLRQMEVTVPLILYARIEEFPDNPEYEAYLVSCFGWIKSMGMNRTRGLGRCRFSLYKIEQS